MPIQAEQLDEPMVSIRDIKASLGILVTEELLASLGFQPAARIQNARLYAKAAVPGMARALADRLNETAEALSNG
jgi:hypothetical protein